MSKSQKAEESLYADEPVSGYQADRLISVARTQLISKFPFFGTLAMRLIPIKSNLVPTAGVDNHGRMYYNEKFLNACTVEDAMFVVSHEVMHLVQRCMTRFPDGGIQHLWNMASDIVVNIALDLAEVSPREEWRRIFLGFEGEYRQKYEKVMITDVIYRDLLKEIKDNSTCEACKQTASGVLGESDKRNKQKNGDSNGDKEGEGNGNKEGEGNGCGGEGSEPLKHTCGNPQGCCSGVTSDSSVDGEEDEDLQNKWVRNVISAAEANRSKGDLPGVVNEMIERLVKPTVTWKDIIRTTGTPIYGKDRYSWKRNSRRGLALGIHLPNPLPETKGGLVFIDTSGSISTNMIVQFCSEVVGILDAIGCSKIYVGLHDTIVYDLVEVGKDDLAKKLKFSRGGTSHIDVFELAEGRESYKGFKLPHGFDVGMIICFTDLMTNFPSSPPKWPVIWGTPPEYYDGAVPWGKKVNVDITA